MPEINAKSLEFDEESKALMSRYEAALAQAYAPTNARWNALKKKLEIDPDSPGPSEMGTPDWAWTEWNIILNEWDKAYVANCAQWWAAGSPVHASMKRYKDWLVQERVPLEEKGDEAAKANYAMMDTPAGGYKSVAAMQAAEDYIRRAQRLFSYRLAEPRCPGGKCRW
jgi:hypothetical protein